MIVFDFKRVLLHLVSISLCLIVLPTAQQDELNSGFWLSFLTCSVWVMMNKNTRKLSKVPEEVRAEIGPYFVEHAAIVAEDNRKLPKLDEDTADYIKKGLTVSMRFTYTVLLIFPSFHQLFVLILCYLLLLLSLYFLAYIIQPRWSDLDVNQHVNNVKYIGWILEVI